MDRRDQWRADTTYSEYSDVTFSLEVKHSVQHIKIISGLYLRAGPLSHSDCDNSSTVCSVFQNPVPLFELDYVYTGRKLQTVINIYVWRYG